jgi:hypothetical protein
VHTHFSGAVREHGVPVLQLDAKHRVGQRFNDRAFNGERIFFRLTQVPSPCCGTARTGPFGRVTGDLSGAPERPARHSTDISPQRKRAVLRDPP